MRRLNPSAETVHYGHFDASLPPVMEVDDGEAVEIRTVTAFPNDPVPEDWKVPEIEGIFAGVKEKGPGPHILTGPVAVRGAQPGDVLEVEIMDIKLGAKYGLNITLPLRGMFGEEQLTRHLQYIPLNQETGMAELTPEIHIPIDPFFGILAVAPPPSMGRIDTRAPGPFGGNIDVKELRAGSRLFLPVWAEGALFSAGDGHAMQGDGEVNSTALETSLEGSFRFRVRTDLKIDMPFAVTDDHLITMGFHESLDEAARRATRACINILEEHYRLSYEIAYRLCSLAADLRISQVVNGNKGVHLMLPHSLLKGLDVLPPFMAQAG